MGSLLGVTGGGVLGLLAAWIWLRMWCLEIGCTRPTWHPFGPEEFCPRHQDSKGRRLP